MFKAKDRRLLEESVVPDVEFIADKLMKMESVDLDGGGAMVVADAVRRALVEAAVRTVEEELGCTFEPPGTKTTYYWRTRAVSDNSPDACPECGIPAHTAWEESREFGLSREDIGEHLAERLDRGLYASEDCPACSRTVGMVGAYEVEEG